MFAMKTKLSVACSFVVTALVTTFIGLGGCTKTGNDAVGGNSGPCGGGCPTGSSCVADGDGYVCKCQPGLEACGTACVDTTSSAANCGGCDIVCGQEAPYCSAGACSESCAEGLTACGNDCVPDTNSNPYHCGSCNNVCEAGLACVSGTCGCAAGASCGPGGDDGGDDGSDGGDDGGGDGSFGGYMSSGNWFGYAFTSRYGSATISPDDFEDAKDWPLCASGAVPASTQGAHGAMIGWSINEGPEEGDPVLDTTPTLEGISYSIRANGGTTAQLRMQIQGLKGHMSEEECANETGRCGPTDRWCANIGTSGSGFVQWDQFNTECWTDDSGEAYDPSIPISQVLVTVPSAATAVNFDFCVDELYESTADGTPGGQGCDLGAGVNGPVSGEINIAGQGNLFRGFVNNGSPRYAIQNNAFSSHLVPGLSYRMTYNGNSFTITEQSGELVTNGAPIAYPSLFIGSDGGHGMATAGSNLPKQVSALTAVPTAWSWSPPTGSSDYNVAYDVWFSPTAGDNGPGSRHFLMVWFHRAGGALAEGEGEQHSAGSYNVGGKTFNVFVSDQFEGRPIISYVATSMISEWSFDLNDFIQDALTRTSTAIDGKPAINSSLYLTNIFAGFELWKGGVGLKTNAFCVDVK